MNAIASLLSLDNITIGLDASSKKRVFEQVGLLIENRYGLARTLVYDALFAREKIGSTALGQGIAIPHGRIKGLKETRAAFFRLAHPVPFDAPDGEPVSNIFVLLVPEAATEHHLQLLSELAQMFSDQAFRDQLAASTSPNAVYDVFAQWPSPD